MADGRDFLHDLYVKDMPNYITILHIEEEYPEKGGAVVSTKRKLNLNHLDDTELLTRHKNRNTRLGLGSSSAERN